MKGFLALARHKWQVFRLCAQKGLWWRGLKHDWYSFRPSQWSIDFQRVPDPEDKTKVELAWLDHVRHSDHHWSHWVMIREGQPVALPMSDEATVEMVCDWKAVFGSQVRWWFLREESRMILHPDTRKQVEELMVFHNLSGGK